MVKNIIKNNIKVYPDNFCECEDKYGNNCGLRIPYPLSRSGLNKHKRDGIPKLIHGHNGKNHSSEAIEKMRKSKVDEKNPSYIDGYGCERCGAKKRGLEFYPLNEKTKIANSPHHIDKKLVVFIPRKLHRSIQHSVKNDKNMDKINGLAFEWCNKRGIELQRSFWSF